MAYDDVLADRIRDALADEDIVEKKMFGGLALLLDGNMVCGVVGDDLCARVGKGGYDEALALPHARPMDFTGRPMRGWLFVGPEGVAEPDDLAAWVDRCLQFARSLPPK